jgi:hypothetical protein
MVWSFPVSRPKVFFDVKIGNGPAKRISFELASDVTPKVRGERERD